MKESTRNTCQTFVDHEPIANPGPPGLVQTILQTVEKVPHDVAVVCADETLTYLELAQRSASVQALLTAAGVGRNDTVGIMLSRGLWLIPSMIGAMATGAGFLPLDSHYPLSRLKHYVDVCGPTVILADNSSIDLALQLCSKVIVPRLEGEQTLEVEEMSSSELAYVLFTSGSTGVPKGVAVGHGALANFFVAMGERLNPSSDDVMLAHTTVAFDISILEFFLLLTQGGTVLLATHEESRSTEHLIKLLGRTTIAQATPSLWKILLANGWSPGATQTILSGGEALHVVLAKELSLTARCLWNLYGPTEATIWTSCHRVAAADRFVSIGEPLRNTYLHVLDEALQPCSQGDLYISGAGLAQEYLGDPGATAAAFRRHPDTGILIYRSGDRVRMHEGGVLEWIGRGEAELKIRGNRIGSREVERELESINGLDAAVVAARSFEGQGEDMLAAYIVVSRSFSKEELNLMLSQHLPAHMIPDLYIVLPGFPLLPNGKFDRSNLPVPSRSNILSSEKRVLVPLPVAPASLAEHRLRLEQICQVFAQLLGREHFDEHDDFFDQGGNSALVVMAAGLLSVKLKSKVSGAIVLESRTPTRIAEALACLDRDVKKTVV